MASDCATLTDSSRCEFHRKQEHKKYDRRHGSPAARGYGHGWCIASKAFLARNPLCVECLKNRQLVAASEVDHIVPHKGDSALF
jgi:5-methylcytosine-specific restriction protein A